MPRCPKCRYTFRVLPDEEWPPQHDCPRCGYGPGGDDEEPEDEEPEDEEPEDDDR